jgi:glyoxalase family protein
MRGVNGLHHITAIAGPAQQNLDFYAGVLGMRLVKKSVNQDDPGTYHLFYADAGGHPGSDLTFFPWAHLAPPRPGHGTAPEVALEIPSGSGDYWGARLERYGAKPGEIEIRFGQRVIPAVDPHGLRLALVEADEPRVFTPHREGSVPADRQVRGLFGARLLERDAAATERFLAGTLGMERIGADGGWARYRVKGAAGVVDIHQSTDPARGSWGVGAVHHLAWRVDDDEHQAAVRSRVVDAGRQPTPVIDRFWFKSVYFKEPGGVLFELATDGPGFAVDEDPAHLGEALVLPPWLERQRLIIEARLPPVKLDHAAYAQDDRSAALD